MGSNAAINPTERSVKSLLNARPRGEDVNDVVQGHDDIGT